MFIFYVVVTFLAILTNLFSATLDFIRYEKVLTKMASAKVPLSWVNLLGVLKAAGAIGLIVGFFIPLIGDAAATGLVLFYIGAIITHLRVRDYSIGLATAFLLFPASSLILGIAVN
ncbi:DoxX family protein [Bacillus oleivorans]|nr:DoxX family protein [Bacillus oleivorans]